MAWNVPHSWAAGELAAADTSASPPKVGLNQQLRDNMTVLKASFTNTGTVVGLNSSYFANTSGTSLVGVGKTAASNSFTAGKNDFSAGAGTRVVVPVGANYWAT